jgi:glycosyltransferase involved in cell wall biosynthesis
VGAEGIGCRHGKELFIADGPKEFANRIITLIDNQSARECFSKNARRFVKDNFSKENTENKWRQLLLTQS